MSRLWIVAQWEFTGTVVRAGFIVTALALPLLQIGLGLLLSHALGSAASSDVRRLPIAVVDTAGVLPDGPSPEPDVITTDVSAAMDLLRRKELEAVFVLSPDYLESGRLRAYARERKALFGLADAMANRERAADLLRRRLISTAVPSRLAERAMAPAADVESYTIGAGGTERPSSHSPLAMLTGAFGLSFLLSLSIFMSSGLLQQAMVAERENRMLEVLLVSVDPLTLLAGKVIGLAGAGLIQIGVYLAFALGGLPMAIGAIDVPLTTIAWAAACFFAGYLMFSCVMAGTGALGRTTQESAQIATAWVIAGALPLFFFASISADGTSALARGFSWFPLTAPSALLLRLGSQTVGGWELAGSIFVTLLTAAAALKGSASLLRRATIAGAR